MLVSIESTVSPQAKHMKEKNNSDNNGNAKEKCKINIIGWI